MEYQNVVRDFARRTRDNLVLLRELQVSNPDLEIYEVTQLINSMLGLLVFPRERYLETIPKIPLEDLVERGWPIPRMIGDYPQVSDLKQLVRYLRNAVAHCNIEFLSDHTLQIRGVRVWNRFRGQVTWKAELSLDDIETITDKFISLILGEEALLPEFRQERGCREMTVYTEDGLLKKCTAPMREVYLALRDEIHRIDSRVDVRPKKSMVCFYSKGRGMVWIEPFAHRLKIHLRKGKYYDKYNAIKPLGWGNYPELGVREEDVDLPYLKSLLRQAYDN